MGNTLLNEWLKVYDENKLFKLLQIIYPVILWAIINLVDTMCATWWPLKCYILFRTTVRLGDLDLNGTVNDEVQPLDIAIDTTIPHKHFNINRKTNDIAIIKMKTKVTFTGKFKSSWTYAEHMNICCTWWLVKLICTTASAIYWFLV